MAAEKRAYRSTARTRRGAVTTFGSRTDVGCVREHNEDSLVVAPPLFVVADGMGGHAAGEVASEIATTVIAENAPNHPDSDALGKAVQLANHAIIEAVAEGKGKAGMGTTCTAAILEGERLVLAQVGDSRAYLLHQGKLQQLTRDHSLVSLMVEAGQLTPEEARTHPRRSVITRALGTDPNTVADLYEIDVEAGDRLLLCSDGLSSMVEDSGIESIMVRTVDPQRCASQLVNEAIAQGGHDNITVVVVDIEGKREEKRRKLALKTKLTLGFVLVLFAAIIAGGAWAINAFVHNSAYLQELDGKVAIYQGVPDDLLWFSYSELVEQTDISLDNLSPGVTERLKEGLRVDSLEAAYELVAEYEAQLSSDEEGTSEASDSADADGEDSEDDSDSSNTTSSTASTSANASTTTQSGDSE